MTLRTLIVDDEALARERLAAMLAEVGQVDVIGEADSGSAAVKAIVDQRPDLVFLDVQMPGLDGFGVLRCTRNAHRPIVVFVTAFDQHAIRAFEVHAADYLLKPVSRARLAEAVRRVQERAQAAAHDKRIDSLLAGVDETPTKVATIPIKDDDGTHLVSVDDITWVEADGDHVRLHASQTTHTARETLAEMEDRLRVFRFVRVHRSAIVNVAAVKRIDPIAKGDYHLTLRDGTTVRSSRHYREAVQALLSRAAP
jgi:two-component system, LytTR family, response regulator